MKFRFAYDDLGDSVSEETGLACKDASRAIQSQAAEADINNIVKSFGVTGMLPQVMTRVPIEEDFDDVVDYKSALLAIQEADRAFMTVPAEVRARFGHDAGAFVSFCSDPANLDECRTLGLAPAVAPAVSGPVTS